MSLLGRIFKSMSTKATDQAVPPTPEAIHHAVRTPMQATRKTCSFGYNHALAITEDGRVIAWAESFIVQDKGQCNVPAGLTDVIAVAASDNQSLTLCRNGKVVAWGEYADNLPPNLDRVVAIGAGFRYAIALKEDGTVVEWGPSSSVPTDLCSVVDISCAPGYVLALTAEGQVVAWGSEHLFPRLTPPTDLRDVVSISAGPGHALALKRDGTVAAWGESDQRILVPELLGRVVAISAGSRHSVALQSNGKVVTWGFVPPMQLPALPEDAVNSVFAGLNTACVQLRDGSLVSWGRPIETRASLPKIKKMQIGSSHLVIVDVDGKVHAWPKGKPETTVPRDAKAVVDVATCNYSSLALREDGTLISWPKKGLLSMPVPEGLVDVSAIAAGPDYCLALRRDGTVKSWARFSDKEVVADLKGVTAIAAGEAHWLALRGDGTVMAYGDNTHGQTNVPPELCHVQAIAAGSDHSLALLQNGSVVAWGANHLGQCNVPVGLCGIRQIAAGSQYSLAVTEQGNLVMWGMSHTMIDELENVVGISAGDDQTVAILRDGSAACVAWGWRYGIGVRPPAGFVDVGSITLAEHSGVMISRDGRLTSWGRAKLGDTGYKFKAISEEPTFAAASKYLPELSANIPERVRSSAKVRTVFYDGQIGEQSVAIWAAHDVLYVALLKNRRLEDEGHTMLEQIRASDIIGYRKMGELDHRTKSVDVDNFGRGLVWTVLTGSPTMGTLASMDRKTITEEVDYRRTLLSFRDGSAVKIITLGHEALQCFIQWFPDKNLEI